ncbi:hypothetical protein [Novosphingobium sp. AP12]|uniref:hypothetical protein n=1 Tax=Novosphingobium sp. AP12 TaxID=1144305 RepID=UPI000271DE12|nr:hypothetical protein [Novosphingobium sp. AP12]EJL21916.1 hypothetical protein PMI02_04901 [Novosphingobium sp. AP12]
MADTEQKKVSKTTLKTAARYVARMKRGERILRDSAGRVQWASGKSVGRVTLGYLMNEGLVRELDTDLFGDRSRGQTLGLTN